MFMKWGECIILTLGFHFLAFFFPGSRLSNFQRPYRSSLPYPVLPVARIVGNQVFLPLGFTMEGLPWLPTIVATGSTGLASFCSVKSYRSKNKYLFIFSCFFQFFKENPMGSRPRFSASGHVASFGRKALLGVSFREPVPGTKQFEVKALGVSIDASGGGVSPRCSLFTNFRGRNQGGGVPEVPFLPNVGGKEPQKGGGGGGVIFCTQMELPLEMVCFWGFHVNLLWGNDPW